MTQEQCKMVAPNGYMPQESKRSLVAFNTSRAAVS
eukprot:CAMPEP_0195579158 /NCGR_PEP_ID=MMETSP0814-20130614/13809_1 /TAXON_ID=97485 /ORGANISM="Prymnesium parvum, Strain Texoma1" /LENGTH=34 /DNA_ID= /DNA_START= /DNA_END= /DNA_ORIENTATION=